MKKYIKNILPAAALLLSMGMSSCVGDLDVTPIDPNKNTNPVSDQLLNKCYANFALAGQKGPDDADCDIDGLDGGTTGFVRQLFNVNELPTDEAICNWGDPGIKEFNYATYDSNHPMVAGFYYRLYFGVTICNQYLANFSDVDETKTAEVRFLRALDYYYLMDLYGNVPFTEKVSAEAAPQYTRKQLYDYIEKELLDIESKLAAPAPKKSTDAGYGRVDKAAAWMLLSRLYLNAQVYTGTAQWQKAADYAKKVMDSNYKLYTGATKNGWTAYQQLFMGDNGENGASVEAILPVLQDGKITASYGTTLFLTASAFDAGVIVNSNGTAGNNTSAYWAGNRARKDLVDKFFPNNNAPYVHAKDMYGRAGDDRALFDAIQADGNKRNIDQANADQVGVFANGFAVAKFNNFYSDGSAGHDAKFTDTDFFLMRAAEAYLTYAEATARLNNGQTTAEGTAAINALRKRAHAQERTSGSYSLDDILDEWSREFYFEGRRRVDLIRYGRFGGNNRYTWHWKGGVHEGTQIPATKNIYAIPTNDKTVNPNIKQNPGY